MKCQCCRNPYGVCHNNHQCACHPKPAILPTRENITTGTVRHLMRGTA